MTIKEHLIQLINIKFPFLINSFQLTSWKLLICFIALLFFACGPTVETALPSIPMVEVAKSGLTLRSNEGLWYHKTQPFSGYSIDHYPNLVLSERIAYYQGKKQGVYQKWFPDGTLSFEANYVNGRKHGTSKTWWKNGVLRSESVHIMGKTNGNQKQWYQSGQLFKSMNIVNGKEEGIQQAWRENGKIYNNYEAKNGRIFGLKRASLCYELEEEVVQVSDN